MRALNPLVAVCIYNDLPFLEFIKKSLVYFDFFLFGRFEVDFILVSRFEVVLNLTKFSNENHYI